ncbi:MAG: conjugal transfer protein TraO [Enterobacterales bacterium endosymbiont of Blomia tropicalis]|uniref:conjugal transfer protein TraO n=1 Tax=Mixta mediterraneensis TaxID=2758443 RepID=UPI0025A6D37F|nr:conjugal transfer protein TraO [Mixta mediterraneensis]MDL4913025.1 conjugal transfer protein TraO [Mixta mediterraneensis]
MSAEKDVSRDVKKTGIIIATVVFSLISGGFLLVSWMSTPPPPASRINVDKVAGGSGKIAPESPQYREILRENNADGATRAQAANSSFIASVGSGTVRQVPPISQDPLPVPQTPPPPGYSQQLQSAPSGVDPDRKKALEAMLKELVIQRAAPAGQVASITGMTGGQAGGNPGGTPVSVYASWTDSLAPTLTPAALSGSPSGTDNVVIPAGSRPGGVIDTAVDSDNTSSQVLAHIPAGPYAGATLMANSVRLAGNGVEIHFTKMTWNNATWRTDVWAAEPDTLKSSVASSVNNRYGTRILLPALAHGLGLGGQLYANANTQILSNGYNTLEGRVGMPNGTAVAGTVLGGAAQQAGQVIASDAQKLPVKQVLVDRGQSIALLFMTAVKESDKETNTTAGAASTGLRIQPAGTFTPATHP